MVLEGHKTATLGLLAEYAEEGEQVEHVGERLVLVDDEGHPVGTVEITDVRHNTFGDVDWAFVQAENEGDASVEEWRAGHLAYWRTIGREVALDTEVVELRLRLLETSTEV
nr:ASCH domain-containing protein [Motilibacter aurantiacus]